jgi:hypothetical protein
MDRAQTDGILKEGIEQAGRKDALRRLDEDGAMRNRIERDE